MSYPRAKWMRLWQQTLVLRPFLQTSEDTLFGACAKAGVQYNQRTNVIR